MFRGFENVGAETGFLFAVLGGNDPGRVLWAPYVFDAAESYGLVLLENGMLVDTARGEPVPLGAARMPRTSPAEVAALDRYDSRALEARVARSPSAPVSANACERARGVFETALLGPESSEEGFPAGEVANEHGFAVRRLNVAQGARLPAHRRSEEEVFLMHRGRLTVLIDGIAVTLGEGDVLTVPVLAMRELVGSDEPAIAHVVRGADRPAPPCSY
jgi:quercetin dioxygenase-like cupin family protein